MRETDEDPLEYCTGDLGRDAQKNKKDEIFDASICGYDCLKWGIVTVNVGNGIVMSLLSKP